MKMKYPKINTLWKRDKDNKFKIMEGDFSCPEFVAIKQWLITEKIDGTNIRIMWSRPTGSLQFGGRTDRASIPAPLVNQLKEIFTAEKMNKVFPEAEEVILFGEGYGNKIQKVGGKYRDDVSFILFDVWIDSWWLEFDKVIEIASKLGVEPVPVDCVTTTDDAIRYLKSKPKSEIAKEPLVIEGIVARSYPLMLFRDGKPIMWKLKVSDYEKIEEWKK